LNSINNNADSFKRINTASKNINNDINQILVNKNSTPEHQNQIINCPNCAKRRNLNVIVQDQNFEIKKKFNFQSKLNTNEFDKEYEKSPYIVIIK
jgi:hypothetical protein